MSNVTLLLFLVCGNLFVNSALCCFCDGFRYFDWFQISNISLNGNAEFYFGTGNFDFHDCLDVEAHWEIQRAYGETEVYTVLNETYPYGRDDGLPDRGLSFNAYCHPILYSRTCIFQMTISPTDMRYNGAQITGVLNLSECFNSSNITDPMTLNIQGLLDAPTDVNVDQVSVESVNVSWTPPFTLSEVPILMYTVYITSQGYTETMNTTETSITLERLCASTTYEISTWNEVGEGDIATYVWTMYQAIVERISELFESIICASCSFSTDSKADGCTIQLQSNQYKFVFNMSRQTMVSHESPLLECFSVPQPGVYSVSVCDIWFGQMETNKSRYLILPNVTIEEATLSHAVVKSSAGHGVCASCVFINNSRGIGCAMELHNDKNRFFFNMSRKNSHELTLLECFSVPEAGVYSVSVYEIQHGGTVGHKVWNLPQITVGEDSTEEAVAGEERAVTGLSVVLSLTLAGVVVAILTVVIFIMKRRRSRITDDAFMASNDDSINKAEEPKSNKSAALLYENTQLPTATKDDTYYEQVELRSTAAIQSEEIELSDNVAYGKVHR